VLAKRRASLFAGGTMTLDEARARDALRARSPRRWRLTCHRAAGMIEIVDENMANATRVHAADNGDDVESRVLIATGGAAPLHAARIAQKLRIDTVVVPKGAGVGSAYGFLRAPIAYEAVNSQLVSLNRFDANVVNTIFTELCAASFERSSILPAITGWPSVALPTCAIATRAMSSMSSCRRRRIDADAATLQGCSIGNIAGLTAARSRTLAWKRSPGCWCSSASAEPATKARRDRSDPISSGRSPFLLPRSSIVASPPRTTICACDRDTPGESI
jgi:hypothetical protein